MVLALPIPAPKLAGIWVALTTPIPWSMAVPLVQSLQHDAVSNEHDIDQYIPLRDGGLTPYRPAVALALGQERDGQVADLASAAGRMADSLAGLKAAVGRVLEAQPNPPAPFPKREGGASGALPPPATEVVARTCAPLAPPSLLGKGAGGLGFPPPAHRTGVSTEH